MAVQAAMEEREEVHKDEHREGEGDRHVARWVEAHQRVEDVVEGDDVPLDAHDVLEQVVEARREGDDAAKVGHVRRVAVERRLAHRRVERDQASRRPLVEAFVPVEAADLARATQRPRWQVPRPLQKLTSLQSPTPKTTLQPRAAGGAGGGGLGGGGDGGGDGGGGLGGGGGEGGGGDGGGEGGGEGGGGEGGGEG
eukprot:2636204-Prymnesium_polylepis.2